MLDQARRQLLIDHSPYLTVSPVIFFFAELYFLAPPHTRYALLTDMILYVIGKTHIITFYQGCIT